MRVWPSDSTASPDERTTPAESSGGGIAAAPQSKGEDVMRILDALVVGGFLTGAVSAFAQATPPSQSPPPADAQPAPEAKPPNEMPPPAHEETTKADEGMKPKATAKTKTVAKTKSIKKTSTKAKTEGTAAEKKAGDESK
jgi:hypothetical protein